MEEAKFGEAVADANRGIPLTWILWVAVLASFSIGLAVGLITVSIFGVILRRVEEKNPLGAIKQLGLLGSYILGVGGVDYFFFDYMGQINGAIAFYFCGVGIMFLACGIPIYIEWRRMP